MNHPYLTREQRLQLREQIDRERRARLARARVTTGRNEDTRRASWRAYYERNRERILERKRQTRLAA